MKKIFLTTVAALIFSAGVFSQAVKDRQVIPVAVNLNQVLRMTITNGGNIEFVFNSIDDYRDGLSADAGTSGSANPAGSDGFYQTDFTVASSTRWQITYGSEQATFIGTDDASQTLDLANVGFSLVNNGSHTFETAGTGGQGTTDTDALYSGPTNCATEVAALEVYPSALIEDNESATLSNAGDVTENDFSLLWRCGTSEGVATPMVTESLLNQSPSPTPDRYVTNVIFELSVDNP